MVGDAYLTVFIALVTGYLLGSIPTAYLLTRWKTGRDIRQLGGGNVGGLNTFKAVSKPLAVAVVITDLAKGAAVILVTYFLFKFDRPYIVLSALAAVAGHNWMAWLKFSGGKGMGPTIGTMAVMLPVYHYYWQLA
ncbi:MAG TPA: glycerol-3-phosphate acyltransferase, partial [Dehalococcoidales bacterium]|nr:glycerol-3-phosphate acyltransferase [Dehalococcoidales bacterium]